MDLNAVAEGIAANIATITDLNTLDFGPADAEPPLFWVGSIDETFDTAMGRGQDELVVTCWLAVSSADDEASQKAVREYMSGSGSRSLRTALRTDKTLGGSASDCRVMAASGSIQVTVGSNTFMGARFTVQVIGRGSA